MPHTPLVTAALLASHLGERDWLPVDCRFELADPGAGQRAFAQGHVPGAVYAHLDRDLSGARGPRTGRHPLPDPAIFAARCAALGIGPGVRVVAYDDTAGLFAARLWWLLRAVGHGEVAVLDGGLAAWRHAQLPLTTVPTEPRAQPAWAPKSPVGAVTGDEVAALLGAAQCRLLDVRARERYTGETEPLDPVAGHVPGAYNLPQSGNLRSDGHFLSAAQLRARYEQALGRFPASAAVVMCGSGVTACHSLLALELAGLAGARLYAGSWSEWCRQPERPIAIGPSPPFT
jgi:thiosulfate/3-mercaptopyruvate sulfurtransferase